MIIKVADVLFDIHNQYGYIEKLVQDYQGNICTKKNNEIYEIYVSKEEILKEKLNGLEECSMGYLESLAFYRKICEVIIQKDVLLIHGSAVMYQQQVILFIAPSGVGKSTHARLWCEYFGNQVTVINDDKPLMRFGNNEIRIYGTPWCGKHGIQKNTSGRISAIVALKQSKENKMRKMSVEEAYESVFCQIYIPKKYIEKVLGYLDRLVHTIPVYQLQCNISKDAVLTAAKGLKIWE